MGGAAGAGHGSRAGGEFSPAGVTERRQGRQGFRRGRIRRVSWRESGFGAGASRGVSVVVANMIGGDGGIKGS